MKIILHSDDINLLNYWEKNIDKQYEIEYDLEFLNSCKDSIIILNYSSLETNVKSIIEESVKNNNKILVLHRVPDIHTAKTVMKYGAKGYGNALMKNHFLASAIKTIEEDMIWLYPALTSMLINDISETNKDTDSILEKVTSREKGVALLLKDGYTYKEIGLKLNITPRTVKAHAQSIYAKLHVKNRLALASLLR